MGYQDRNETLGETPERLRVLEKGWRERRRVILGETSRINEEARIHRQPQLHQTELELTERPEKATTTHLSPRQSRQIISRRPLTPPPTPPLPSSDLPSPHKAWVPPARTSKPVPIVRGHLPPTGRPVCLPKSTSTIHVLPTGSKYEMMIELGKHQDIRIRRGGREIETRQSRGGLPTETVVIKLNDCEAWSAREASQWESVSQLVNGFKRMSARVKIWHELGRLTVSCSEPPDIVLAYDTASVSNNGPQQSTYVSVGRGFAKTKCSIKTRVRYSPSTLSLQLDTFISRTTPANDRPLDTHRVKRVVTTACRPACEYAHGLLPDNVRQACKGLGAVPVEWREEELEAIGRLWALRREWQRYM